MMKGRGGVLYATDQRYCIDNGAMIAQAGMLMYNEGITCTVEESTITQRFRTDTVKVTWRS